MKALELLKADRDFCLTINNDKAIITQYDEAIEELKDLYKKLDGLKEYVRVANHYIEFYRCRCGALGRVGYLCSNEDCTEE